VDRLTLAAPAKLNLRLLVGPLGEDGYHPVRTLMVALPDLADTVTVEGAAERSVACEGIDGPANLAWHALEALERRVGALPPLAVRIVKRIPAQSGLGGGSSDAAATLVAADRLLGLGLGTNDLEAVAAEVGSDVPFFVRGGASWAAGRGEVLAPAAAPPFAALLARPAGGLATAAVYAAFDRMRPPDPADDTPAPERSRDLPGWTRNDLWQAALALRPGLGRVARALRAAGARETLLCGSGSAVAGLFEELADARDAAARLDPRLVLGAVAFPGASAAGPAPRLDRGPAR